MREERNPLLQALREQMETDQQQHLRCQRGEHDMLSTATPGVVICRVCRTLGVCLWCGWSLPTGACISVCSQHSSMVQWQARHLRPVAMPSPDTQEVHHEP